MKTMNNTPLIKMLARGRKEIQALFEDEHVGYYGQCYDFAIALRRVLATGHYVVLEGTDSINGTVVYHVYLGVKGTLLDASGIHDMEATRASLTGSDQLREADPKEIEPYGEEDTIEFMATRLRSLH